MQMQLGHMSPDGLMSHLNKVHYDLAIAQRSVVELITMVNAEFSAELTVVPMAPPPGAGSLTLAQVQAPPHPQDVAREPDPAALLAQDELVVQPPAAAPTTPSFARTLGARLEEVLLMVPQEHAHSHHDHHDHPASVVTDTDFSHPQPTPYQAPQPTPSQPTLAQPSQPVQSYSDADARAQERFAERAREQLKHFVGNGSLFVTHLSPQTIQGGRGFIRPNAGKTKLYTDDLKRIPIETLKHWPSGFYRNQESSSTQFFLNVTTAFAVVEGLLNPTATVSVVIHPDQGLRDIQDVSLPQLLMLKELFEAELRALGESAA